MSAPVAPALQDFEAEEVLDPALLRFLEALAEAHAEEDWALLQAEAPRRAEQTAAAA